MSSTAASNSENRPHARRVSLWFGLVGGGVGWLLHLLTAYAIAEFGCVGGLGGFWKGGILIVAWLEIALTIVAATIAGTATFVAYRCHRTLPSTGAAIANAFTARAGMIASGILTFVILFESIPILFYLRSC